MTEIKSVQFGAPRGGRERKRERDRESGGRRGETTQHHGTFFPMIVPPTDGHGWERLTAKCLLHPAAAA